MLRGSTTQHGLIVVVGVLALLGCGRDDSTAQISATRRLEDKSSVQELAARLLDADLETKEQVQAVVSNAANSQRAILFVHVDWAVMLPQTTRYVEFMLAHQSKHPRDPIMFHYVDCTPGDSRYETLRALPGWQELQQASGGGSLIHGWGELVWLDRGRVLHVAPIHDFASTADLIEQTERLMPVDDE